jgi:phenylalanyl-tRNA synthetase, alpha subunit (EC 6.1.1.20)
MTLLSQLQEQLQNLANQAASELEQVSNLDELEKLRLAYLGKKGSLSLVLGGMGKLPPADRPIIGAIANDIKQAVQDQIDQRKEQLTQAQIQAQLAQETLDVTMPGIVRVSQGKHHPITSTIDRMLDILVGLGFTVVQGPEIETDYYNFEALNTPADHPARDMQDTLYLAEGKLLRTQTSSVQIRYMETNEPPLRIACPGRVYRKDEVDATHSPIFIKLNYWRWKRA